MMKRQSKQPAQPQIMQQPVVQAPPQQFVPQMQMSPLPPSAPSAPQSVMKEVPMVAYDYRTILIPHTVTETHSVMETRLVDIKIRLGGTFEDGGAQNAVHVPLQAQISFPVFFQKQKVVAVPRKVSIPRPMVEKRVVTKMVPKVIQVEEQYEIECAVTEMKKFFVGADTSGDGMLSMAEWQAANAGRGYNAAQMKQMFVSLSSPPCLREPACWLARWCAGVNRMFARAPD